MDPTIPSNKNEKNIEIDLILFLRKYFGLEIIIEEIDPLNMLEDSRIRLNVLTDKYKSLLKIYHPDRAGASSHDMFVTVKDAFDKQQYVINSKIMDKDYNQLKQDYSEYSQNIKKKSQIFSMVKIQ